MTTSTAPLAPLPYRPVLVERPVRLAPDREPPPGQCLARHLAAHGPVGEVARLFDVVELAGLTGCGGAHFPVARKWATARRAGGGGTLVMNGAEGEPASAKDAVLLLTRAHLVLDGLFAAAAVTSATDVVIWLHAEAEAPRAALERALAERAAAGFDEPDVRFADAPARYLSGESSAIVRALDGGPTLPRFTLVPAASRGVGGRPTLVHNVETLARVGLLARSAMPVPGVLLTLTTPLGRAVCEVDPDESLTRALASAGLGGRRPAAVLLGGYGGTWAGWDEVADRPLREFGAPGLSLGAGVVLTPPAEACGTALTAALQRFLAAAGARQCGPCRFGLDALTDTLDALVAGRARSSALSRLHAIADQVDGRGACGHPDGAVRMLRSALRTFAADFVEHAAGRPCAGAQDASSSLPGITS